MSVVDWLEMPLVGPFLATLVFITIAYPLGWLIGKGLDGLGRLDNRRKR